MKLRFAEEITLLMLNDEDGEFVVSAVPKMDVDGRYEDAVYFQASSSPSL